VPHVGAEREPSSLGAPSEVLRRELVQLEDELVEQVERGDRAESTLQVVHEELVEERARRQAAERTLVTLQTELSKVRSDRGELERLRREVEELKAAGAGASTDRLATDRLTSERGHPPTVAPASDPPAPQRQGPSDEPVRRAHDETVLLGPEDIGSRVVFARHLREGARLRRTERFARFEPVSRLDIRVHEYARRANQLAEIRMLADRRVSEEDILRVLFTFFERGLLRIEPADERSAPGGSGIAQ
jgi:hypothetical protein